MDNRTASTLSDNKSSRTTIVRWAAFAAGVVINSFGIAFITKAALGTSPISSVPYVLSLYFPLSFGVMTFIINAIYVGLQFVLLGREMKPIQLLQLVVNLVFSAAIDVSMSLLGWLNPVGIIARVASLILGCAILAFGVALEVAPGVLMVPGEGMVNALARRTGVRFGTTKICFDTSLIIISGILCFILFGGLNGIGVGTIVSALLVGFIVNIFNRHLKLLSKLRSMRPTPAVVESNDSHANAA